MREAIYGHPYIAPYMAPGHLIDKYRSRIWIEIWLILKEFLRENPTDTHIPIKLRREMMFS
jgi:hypothetical protein